MSDILARMPPNHGLQPTVTGVLRPLAPAAEPDRRVAEGTGGFRPEAFVTDVRLKILRWQLSGLYSLRMLAVS